MVDLLLLEGLLHASDRLEQVRAILGREGLTATGSVGQVRPHPLLDVESSLRREIAVGFEQQRLTRADGSPCAFLLMASS